MKRRSFIQALMAVGPTTVAVAACTKPEPTPEPPPSKHKGIDALEPQGHGLAPMKAEGEFRNQEYVVSLPFSPDDNTAKIIEMMEQQRTDMMAVTDTSLFMQPNRKGKGPLDG